MNEPKESLQVNENTTLSDSAQNSNSQSPIGHNGFNFNTSNVNNSFGNVQNSFGNVQNSFGNVQNSFGNVQSPPGIGSTEKPTTPDLPKPTPVSFTIICSEFVLWLNFYAVLV